MEAIYKRGILNPPSMLYFDAGTEFKGEFLKYLKQSDILYKVSKTARHRQTSLVENKNKYIAKAIFRRQLEEEMLTGEVSRQWTDQLKEIVQQINEKIKPYKEKVFPNKLVETAKTKKLLDTIEEVQQEKGDGHDIAQEEVPQERATVMENALSPKEQRELELNGFLKRTNKPSNLPLRWNPITDDLEEVPRMAAAGAGRSRKKMTKRQREKFDAFKASTHHLNVLKQFIGQQGDEVMARRIGLLIDAEIKKHFDYTFKDPPMRGTGRKKKVEKNNDETYCSGDSCILLPADTKVRVQLDAPMDYVSGKRLIGNFRATDIRFSKEPHTISDVVIKPGSPPLYILDDDTTTAYTKNQLQVIDTDEKGPDEKAIQRLGKKQGQETFYVEAITDHKMVKKKKFYHVKWKGMTEKTWEPAKTMKEDVPEYVQDYEESLKD